MPEIVRVSESNVKPAGKSGVIEYLYGGVPLPSGTAGNVIGSIACANLIRLIVEPEQTTCSQEG